MLSTLAHRPGERRSSSAVRRSAGVVAVLMGAACSSSADARVTSLRPATAATYRMVGTEHDSRSGATRRMVETFVVEPAFTRAGKPRQITTFRDRSGRSRRWETEFRRTGAYRVREATDGAAWDWTPPLRVLALPLRPGATWTDSATVTLPDMAGTRRVSTVRIRSKVTGTERVVVGDGKVTALVIVTTTATKVTDTDRATGQVTTHATTSTGRTWFAPSDMRIVKSDTTTSVTGDPAGGYELTRRVTADRL